MPKADEWVSVKAAAIDLGLAQSTVIDLTERVDPCTAKPFLKSRRTSPRRLDICGASVQQHLLATQDPEFWEMRREKERQLTKGIRDKSRRKSLVTR
ncbi:MAG TPA: hypothetical protein VK846_00215 [Candidatus Limnocylindria bacterium]|nr:hypothetical protein [Candidatus Limnocylindria bacterium]